VNRLNPDEFWEFSVDLYQGKQDIYLHCQNNWGLSVNMLLLIQYLSLKGWQISLEQIRQLCENNASLVEEIVTMRNKRVATGRDNIEAYQRLKLEELELEKQHQQQLIQQLNRTKIQPASSQNSSLRHYLSVSKISETDIHTILNLLSFNED
jgi:uncharacterized protein (TIGR02444 family)